MTKMHALPVGLAMVLLGALGCDKSPKGAGADGGAASDAGASAVVDASPQNVTGGSPTAEKRAPAMPPAVIPGLGEVPAWAADRTTKHCTVNPDAKRRLDALRQGTDAVVAAGTADVPQIMKDVGADTCIATRKALATALNDGGFARYNTKKYDEANRYWRAALVVRPALIVARYNLACGLALSGSKEPAVGQISELAHAASEGDASAANFLEKAKSDKDLESIRNEPSFKASLAVSNAGLVGPRKEPETAAKVVALLPEDFRKVRDEIGVTPTGGGFITYKPAVTNVWTWRPDATTELLVTTIIDDPAKVGRPKPDLNADYGAIAVLRRGAAGKLTLLTVRKTGESPPTVAAGKNGSVVYSFEQACGALSGVITWTGTAVDIREKNCRDL